MGCGSSQAAKNVIAVGEAPTAKSSQIPVPKQLNSKQVLKPIPRNPSNEKKTMPNGDELFGENGSDRPNSTSSHDSGYADNEYKKIITEKSNPELVQKIEKEFQDRQARLEQELIINGRSCPQLMTAKEKQKLDEVEELKSLQLLKNNGLVQKPMVKKENYVRFEIIEERLASENNNNNTFNPSSLSGLPPIKRLPQRFVKDDDKNTLTSEKIAEKLRRANQRKMEQTQLKLNNITTGHENQMRDSFDYPKSNSVDSAVVERQKKLLEIRDKIRAKNAESTTPRTPRSQELLNELNNFRSKTPATFKPVYD